MTELHNENQLGLAIVTNGLTPYHIHFHHRIATEIPQFKLHTLLYRSIGRSKSYNIPLEINAVWFAGEKECYPRRSFLRHPLREFQVGSRMIEYVKNHNIRAIISNGLNDLGVVRLLRYCKRAKIPFLLRGDGNMVVDKVLKRPFFWRQVRRLLYGSCDGWMPMSESGQKYYEKYGADPAKCFWVPCESNYDLFLKEDMALQEILRQRYGLSKGRKHFIFCGCLSKVKRIDLLLDGFIKIAQEQPDWDLLIAGTGELREELQRRIPEAMRNRVKWLGFCEPEELSQIYHIADVMALVSEREGNALVVGEAAAAGLPIVASDAAVAGHEMVKDGISGRIFPAGDLNKFVEALRDIVDETNLMRYRQAMPKCLADWRRDADPVEGVRRALQSFGLLPAIR